MQQNKEQLEVINVDEAIACLKLIRLRGYSTAQKRKVISHLESFSAAIHLKHYEWEELLGKKLPKKGLPTDQDIDKDIDWLKQENHHFFTFTDDQYPQHLNILDDAPLGFFAKGQLSVLNTIQIAIIGSRRQTPMGKKVAEIFSQQLVNAGITITSGLAKGIDASAHLACCEAGGQTIAVAGCGLDSIYPRQHEALAQRIQLNGCLISEFPIGTPPKRENFPARNRIIAGLSEGVLVIEAAKRSGSLITARLAMEQGKEVFAVPGSIMSPQSSGCHWLIQQGAVLTQHIDDILFELQLPLLQKISANVVSVKSDCEVLRAIAYEATSMDDLVLRTNINFQMLSQRLMELELDGLITRAHNGDYFRIT